MNGFTRILAAASAALLAACGSGSGGNPSPLPTARPLAGADRAQASVTIKYTQGLLHLAGTSAARRSPRFVDPQGQSLAISSYSTIGRSIDGGSYPVAPDASGAQNLTVPIASSPNELTILTVVENGANGIIAQGEVILNNIAGGSFVAAGALTLYMTPAGILLTTDGIAGRDAAPLSNNPNTPTTISSYPLQQSGFYLLPFDVNNNYTYLATISGAGGIPPVQINSQLADRGGTSRIASDGFGKFHVVFDTAHDAVTVHLQTFIIDPNIYNPGTSTADAYVRFVYNGG